MKVSGIYSTGNNIAIISGIPTGDSGTGRFISHLQARVSSLTKNEIKLIARPEKPAFWQLQLWLTEKKFKLIVFKLLSYVHLLTKFWLSILLLWFKRNQTLFILHPQNLGYRLAINLIISRANPSYIYLLDSSFFCISSYNHTNGEHTACTRCIEFGFVEIDKNGCKPFPRKDWRAVKFTHRLLKLVKSRKVYIAAQNLRQATLAQKHFQLDDLPPVIGLWTQDWDDVFAENAIPKNYTNLMSYSWDVLFHGYCLDAKGASWVASLAAHCPDLRFLFPFAQPDWFKATENCTFLPCSWESGLRTEIEKSRFVIVPSLWSAPIEGALVKSIVCARAVAVVNNPTSFCDEIPDEIILKLPTDPFESSKTLISAINNNWSPDGNAKAYWLLQFAKYKVTFVPKLLSLTSSSNEVELVQ